MEGMAQYRVELIGEAREVYIVEADSEQDARDNWSNGWHQLTEAFGMDVESVALDDEPPPLPEKYLDAARRIIDGDATS